MFSRCPHCDAQQAVTTQQLSNSRGLLPCLVCGQIFDALPSLTEQADEAVQTQTTDFDFSSPVKPLSVWRWRLTNGLLVLALLIQVGYFEAERLLQQPRLHGVLTQICQTLGCQVSAYNHTEDWSVSHSDLQAHLDNRYLVTAALTNQSDLPHSLPALKLTLTDYQGQPIAKRIFAPQAFSQITTLPANQTTQIRLPLVVSVADIGGFTLTVM
ncbi:MAG: hypothetical protein CTY19_10220 [Methylomonas sp.]|nr:MAG: hypothetical protein CTY19_10220 [Methylomonas sp.]